MNRVTRLEKTLENESQPWSSTKGAIPSATNMPIRRRLGKTSTKRGKRVGARQIMRQLSRSRRLGLPETITGIHTRLAEAKLRASEATTAELSAEFKQFWAEREHLVNRNARVFALYEGSVIQIRRQKNIEGSEQEEDAITTRIAAVAAEQLVMASEQGTVQKSIWRYLRDSNSALHLDSDVLVGTRFERLLRSNMYAEGLAARRRLDAEKLEQQKREQVAADAVEREYNARDTAASSTDEPNFEKVSAGVLAPPPRRLPPVMEELPEEEEARELAIEDLPERAWWRSLRNPTLR
jgi:hypothetical protein